MKRIGIFWLIVLLPVLAGAIPTPDLPDSADIYNSLGADAFSYGNITKAEQLLKKALQYDCTDIALTAIYNNLGSLALVQWDYQSAEYYFIEAERIAHLMGNQKKQAIYYNNLSYLYGEMRDYQKAISYGREAVAIFGKLGLNKEQSAAYTNLGLFYAGSGQYEQAFAEYRRSLAINKGLDYTGLSNTWRNIAEAYQHIGLPDSALQCYRQSVKVARQYLPPGHYITGENMLPYAGQLIEARDFTAAIRVLNDALAILQKNFGNHHFRIAECLVLYGRYYENLGQQALAMNYYKRAYEAVCLVGRQGLTSPGAKPVGDGATVYVLEPLQQIAQLAWQMYQQTSDTVYLGASYRACLEAISVISRVQRRFQGYDSKLLIARASQKIFPLAASIAYAYWEATGNRQYLGKVFTLAESGKASVLLNLIQSDEALTGAGLPDSVRAQEDQLKRRLAYAEEHLTGLLLDSVNAPELLRLAEQQVFWSRKAYDLYNKTIEDRFSDYYQLKYDAHVATPEECRTLFPNANLLEYSICDTVLIGVLVNRNGVFAFRKSIDTSFFGTIRRYTNSLQSRWFVENLKVAASNYSKEAYYLYCMLIAPLEADFVSNHLTIIPDGVLAMIPFEALIDQQPVSKHFHFGEMSYLVHKYQTNYAYSATVLCRQGYRFPRFFPSILAMAPVYPGQEDAKEVFRARQAIRGKLSAIHGAGVEVEEVAAFFKGKVIRGEGATEDAFRAMAPSFDILHLAMHTYIDDKTPFGRSLYFRTIPRRRAMVCLIPTNCFRSG